MKYYRAKMYYNTHSTLLPEHFHPYEGVNLEYLEYYMKKSDIHRIQNCIEISRGSREEEK